MPSRDTSHLVRPRRLAHLVLRVRNAKQSEQFYTTVLGLKVTDRSYDMVFMSLDDSKSHEIALLQIDSNAPGPEQTRAGLYHFAWEMATFEDLEGIHQQLQEQGVRIVGYGEHGVSSGVYFLDPDGNEIEVFYELPRSEWPAGDIFVGGFPRTLQNRVPVT